MAATTIRKFEEDIAFLEQNKEKFRNKYPDKWIAVYDKQIVRIGDDLEQVVAELVAQGIDPGHVVIDFLATEETTLVLFL